MDIKEITQGFSVRDKTALIVGCGGLGTNIAVHLAGAGMKRIYLCDFDTVNESNLNRQFLYTNNDIGSKKCEKIKEILSLYAPDTDFIATDKKILCGEDLSFADDCDIIISAVDNIEARKALEEFSHKLDIPVVFGGIDGFYGTVYMYIPKKSPCPECAGIYTDVKAKTNVSAAAGVIGSMQSSIALKYLITNNISLSGKIYLFDGDLWETLPIIKQKDCSKCSLTEVIR